MLDAPTIALCPKLCRHNVSNLFYLYASRAISELTATGRESKEDGKPIRARGIIVNYSVQDCGPGGELSEEDRPKTSKVEIRSDTVSDTDTTSDSSLLIFHDLL